MTSPVDPNEVLMTGENSFIRLSSDGGETMTDRLSHWRVLWCPAGAGHALFVKSELTRGKVRIYGDNLAVVRWLQRNIETILFAEFADTEIPVAAAAFERHGDPRSSAVEVIESDEDLIRMTWYECIDPFVLHMHCGGETVAERGGVVGQVVAVEHRPDRREGAIGVDEEETPRLLRSRPRRRFGRRGHLRSWTRPAVSRTTCRSTWRCRDRAWERSPSRRSRSGPPTRRRCSRGGQCRRCPSTPPR